MPALLMLAEANLGLLHYGEAESFLTKVLRGRVRVGGLGLGLGLGFAGLLHYGEAESYLTKVLRGRVRGCGIRVRGRGRVLPLPLSGEH